MYHLESNWQSLYPTIVTPLSFKKACSHMIRYNEIKTIRNIAIGFSKVLRAIVMDVPEDKISLTFPLGGPGENCFPNGGCSTSSNLFGLFLLEKGIVNRIDKCTYEFIGKTEITHTWLNYDDCIIDLTCCQFDNSPDVPSCPYDCPLVSVVDRDWHTTNWVSEFSQGQNVSDTTLNDVYREILDNIKNTI